LQVLLGPVDFEPAGDRVHETFVALEDFQGPGDPAHREKRRVRGAKGGVRVSQALPVGERSRSRNTQRVKSSSADRNGVSCLIAIEAQALRDTGGNSVGPLCSVIEALVADRSEIAQSALNLIGNGESCQEFLTGAIRVFASREDGAEIVARVASLVLCEI